MFFKRFLSSSKVDYKVNDSSGRTPLPVIMSLVEVVAKQHVFFLHVANFWVCACDRYMCEDLRGRWCMALVLNLLF